VPGPNFALALAALAFLFVVVKTTMKFWLSFKAINSIQRQILQ
jgi:hypothetical protein